MSKILNRIEREMRHQKRTPAQLWTRRITIVLLCISIPLMMSELALRLAGYCRPQIDLAAQTESLRKAVAALNARFKTDAFEFDSHLLWKLKPGKNLNGLDIGKDGVLTWEHPTHSPRSTESIKVLCLGDSVTAVTYRTYPQIAEKLADAGINSRHIEVYNAAVPGYTTEQALRLLPELKHLRPDVVVLCFGWNDHFPALTMPDRELGVANVGGKLIHKLLKDVRLYQLLGAPLGAHDVPQLDENSERIQQDSRVPPSQYRQNLEDLVSIARSWSALPVLATEPENLGAETEQYLENNQFIAPENRNNKARHTRYNEIVREVATNSKVALLDIEEEFVRRPRDFMLEPDGIHLTGRGHNHVARLILGVLRNEGKITAADYDSIAQAEKHDTTALDKPRVSWTLIPEELAVPVDQPFSFTVLPQNSGNTRWVRKNIIPRFNLQKNVSYGSTSIFTRWRTIDSPTTGIAKMIPIPSDILPGEATSMTLTMTAPARAGNYELEIGIMADHIGPLTNYGAESTTLTVSAVNP